MKYQPNQSIVDYNDWDLATSSVITGDFTTDSLKYGFGPTSLSAEDWLPEGNWVDLGYDNAPTEDQLRSQIEAGEHNDAYGDLGCPDCGNVDLFWKTHSSKGQRYRCLSCEYSSNWETVKSQGDLTLQKFGLTVDCPLCSETISAYNRASIDSHFRKHKKEEAEAAEAPEPKVSEAEWDMNIDWNSRCPKCGKSADNPVRTKEYDGYVRTTYYCDCDVGQPNPDFENRFIREYLRWFGSPVTTADQVLYGHTTVKAYCMGHHDFFPRDTSFIGYDVEEIEQLEELLKRRHGLRGIKLPRPEPEQTLGPDDLWLEVYSKPSSSKPSGDAGESTCAKCVEKLMSGATYSRGHRPKAMIRWSDWKNDDWDKTVELSSVSMKSEWQEEVEWNDKPKKKTEPEWEDVEWESEQPRKCCECSTTEGLTTIQAGTFCWDCLPINLGAESSQEIKEYITSIHDGDFLWRDGWDNLEFTLQTLPMEIFEEYKDTDNVDGAWEDSPVNSHRLEDTLSQFRWEGDRYPPVVLELDKNGYYDIIDGYHRLNALQILDYDTVEAWVGIPASTFEAEDNSKLFSSIVKDIWNRFSVMESSGSREKYLQRQINRRIRLNSGYGGQNKEANDRYFQAITISNTDLRYYIDKEWDDGPVEFNKLTQESLKRVADLQNDLRTKYNNPSIKLDVHENTTVDIEGSGVFVVEISMDAHTASFDAEESGSPTYWAGSVAKAIVNEMGDDYYFNEDLHEYNCVHFAQEMSEYLTQDGIPHEIQSFAGYGGEVAHAWVYVPSEGEYYDAWTPYGVSDWKDLDFWETFDYTPEWLEQQTPESFEAEESGSPTPTQLLNWLSQPKTITTETTEKPFEDWEIEPTRCIWCGSGDIDSETPEHQEEGVIYSYVGCKDCGCVWREEYRYVDNEVIEEGEKRILKSEDEQLQIEIEGIDETYGLIPSDPEMLSLAESAVSQYLSRTDLPETFQLHTNPHFVFVSADAFGRSSHVARFRSQTSSHIPIIMLSSEAIRESADDYGVSLKTAVETTVWHELGHVLCELWDMEEIYPFESYNDEEEFAESIAESMYFQESFQNPVV